MPIDAASGLLNHVRSLAGVSSGHETSDRELLHRFANRRDETAFEALMRRHGPMVLRVGRRVLANAADTEDVFQATFLLLARKAASTDWHDSVANWLYGVAHRLARKAKDAAARRSANENRVPLPVAPDPLAEITGRELLNVLDEELLRLPDKYREPLLLCYLEGLTRDEAARRLGWPLSTVKHRAARGREILGQALACRGVGPGLALLVPLAVAGRGNGAVPRTLLQSTLQGIRAGGVAPRVSALIKSATPVAGLTRIHALVVLALVGLVGAGVAVATGQKPPQEPPPVVASQAEPVPEPTPRTTDALGDPLPTGALMRLGTRRHRVQTWPWSWHDLPNGRSYLVLQRSSDASEVRRLDSASGRVLETWPIPNRQNAIGISADGRYLLLSTQFIYFGGIRVGNKKEEQDWELTLYDLVQRKTVWTKREMLENMDWKRAESACFSPDGKWIVSMGTFGGGLRLWDAATGKELWNKPRDKDKGEQSVESLGFVANGNVLVLRGRKDNTIFQLDRATGKQLRSFSTMNTKESHGATLAPDGSAVLFGNYSPAVRVWDLATGRERKSLAGHKGWARQVAFSPDGRTVATGGNDPFVLVRDWPSGQCVRTLEVGEGTIEEMAISRDGQRLELLFWGEQALRFFDLTTGKALPTFLECHQGSVHGVAVAPDGALFSYGKDRSIRTWDLRTGKAVDRFNVELDLNAGGFALSGDGRRLAASNSDNGAVSVYERATGRLVCDLPTGRGITNEFVLSPDGRYLAGAAQGVVQVWDVAARKTVLNLKDVRAAYGITCAFSPDGRQFAATEHGKVRFWDVATWKERAPLAAYAPLGLVFSPDGRTLATASVEGVRLYEMATHGERAHIRPEGYPSGSLRFSPSGRCLAWVSDHKTIHVWDVQRGVLLGPFAGHDDRITGLAFTADGRSLASSSDDSTILIWDVAEPTAKAPATPGGDLDLAWRALVGADSKAAYEAIRVLSASPHAAVERIRRYVKPVPPIDADRFGKCLRALDSDEFEVRERATRNLEEMGDGVVAPLERFLASKPSLEAKNRAAAVLATLGGPERLRQLRVFEILERIGDLPSRRLLEALGQGMPEAWLTREAKGALERLNTAPRKVPSNSR